MIQATKVSYSFPQKDLYDNISFHVPAGAHTALVGTSGSGKTTLVDMIINPDKYLYDGTITLTANCRIGYTSQFYHHDQTSGLSVFNFMAEPYHILQAEMEKLCQDMETAEDIEPLLEQYQSVLDQLEIIGGDDFLPRLDKLLNLSNLMTHRDRSIAQLSGGEFKLIQMMREMLRNPDLMIMDEPDVFLDFENLNSLRRLINYHKGTLLVITHNRYLLNHCFNQILHIENQELQQFDGRYMDYRLFLLDKKIELLELAHNDSEEIIRNDALIDRLRQTATDTAETVWGRSLKARVKIQERLVNRRIEEPFVFIREPEIHFSTPPVELPPEPEEPSVPTLTFLDPNRDRDETPKIPPILAVNDYEVAFDQPLLSKVNFEIAPSDKVAIIGANGTGKTTLMNDLFESVKPSISRQADLSVAHLSQEQSDLDMTNRVIEEFPWNTFETPEELEFFLETYGFKGDGLYQKVDKLSGGEKNLLQLAKLSTRTADMLFLDEPTSHLDTDTQVALEVAIKEYEGSILMVSHDFYFIANCMDYVLLAEKNTIRKMSIRAFRKMIYAHHFDQDYLALEQKKYAVELELSQALLHKDFDGAKALLEQLTGLVAKL